MSMQLPLTGGTILCGDCKYVLREMDEGIIDLIYLDPPFFTKEYYERIWKDGAEVGAFQDVEFIEDELYSRFCSRCGARLDKEVNHCSVCGEAADHADIERKNDIWAYIRWMEPRLRECRRVLKKTGSIYLHCDWHANAYLRILMDDIFGYDNMRDEIIWSYSKVGGTQKKYLKWHETIFRYTKSDEYTFNMDEVREPYSQAVLKSLKTDEKGEYYTRGLGSDPSVKRIKKTYVHPKGKVPGDVWNMGTYTLSKKERLGYPTQKPEALLERIIKASSDVNDLILDPFCGCGTSIAVAKKLRRRWIGIDVSVTACRVMGKRLGIPFHDIDGVSIEKELEELRVLSPLAYQKRICYLLGGRSVGVDRDGIDGYTETGSIPIQVKQHKAGIGRSILDEFHSAIRRAKTDKGILVGFYFSSDAVAEAARLKRDDGITITLLTDKEVLYEFVWDKKRKGELPVIN